MKENSSLENIYIGALTTVFETLVEMANTQVGALDEDNPEVVKVINGVRFRAVSDLVTIANQLRNHARMDTIINDPEMARAYFTAGQKTQI